MGKVELPEVSEEKVEASLVVVFAAPLQRLGLADTTRAKRRRVTKAAQYTPKQCRAERRAIVLRQNNISDCMPPPCDSGRKRMRDKRASVHLQSDSPGSRSGGVKLILGLIAIMTLAIKNLQI